MALKATCLLKDDPATADEFGTHNKIAGLIRDEILHSTEGRSIALIGEWGSGKSTIIELLKRDFADENAATTHLFIYDAWSHQGDSLRRAFLDDFIASLNGRMTEKEVIDATDQVWNRTETTTTTKEPVLRRHAKVLLLSLALIPLGMKLFELPAKTGLLEGLGQGRNILAYLFLLAPVLAVALFGLINWTNWTRLKNFLFGDSHRESEFSVLSLFIEKVQGHVECRHIKTPVDSIRAFRDVFSQLIDNVHSGNKELRVIIIIDNIDRIPPDQARDFWSTMQTFFGDGGGLRNPQTRKYWLVAPFSVEALSFLFRDNIPAAAPASNPQAEARTRAKAYIDRTFSLAFHVPPPILTNWRRYLLSKLREAFPEHAESDLIAARDVFDFGRSGSVLTPREMKLFVNSLVALYRQRGEDISFFVMAIYILHRDEIVGTEISDGLLSPGERRLIEDADWRVPIAALHFGVSLEEATQLLLQEPMLAALREGSKDKLKELEGRPGFMDVLRQVTALELELPGVENAVMLAQMAGTIGGLEGASKPELAGVWRDIRGRLKVAKDWVGLQALSAEGIDAALTHTSSAEKGGLCEALAASLSKATIADPEGDFQSANALAANWLRVAEAVAEGIGAGQAPKIGLPGAPKLKIELLQQLAESDAPDSIKTVFRLDTTPDELSKALAAEISAGRFLRVQVPLVSLLVEKLKIEMQWAVILSACADRLRVEDIGTNETQSLVSLLLTARTIGGFANALNILKDLSTEGHLSHLMQQHRSTPTTRATEIAAVMLANPAFDRPTQIGQSQSGDVAFNQLADAAAFDSAQITGIGEVIKSVRAGSILFETGARNKKISRLVAAVVGDLTRSTCPFDLDPKTVIEQRAFLEAHADLNPIAAFLKSLTSAKDVLTLLTSQPFEVDRAQFYRAALGIASGDKGAPYVNYLAEGIRGLDKGQWDKSLNTSSGAHFELLELTCDLRTLSDGFELSTPARDAALDQIRKAGSGTPAPSDEVRGQLSKLLQLLPDSLRMSLMRDVVDDMAGQTDPVHIVRLIEMAGDHLSLEEENDLDRILRRIFSPAIGNPTERSAAWMATVVGRRLEFFRQMPEETKKEFGVRLRVALQNKVSLGAALIDSMTIIASLLDIDLSEEKDSSDDPDPTIESPR